ncbi:ABC transporter substrate-binding protein [Xanthobacter sp. ZOL 2024]
MNFHRSLPGFPLSPSWHALRRALPVLVLVGGLSPVGLAQAQTTITLGAAQTSAGSLPIVVADQKGLFAAEGLKYERLDFKGGAPAAQALASGSIDACICAGDHAVHLEEKGLGGKVLVALADTHSYALLSRADAPATSLADLKGKKIGITSAGSLTDTTLRYALKAAGLDPDKDVQLIAVGRAGPQRAALQAGVIDAGMFTTPDIQITLAEPGAYKIVEDFRKLPYPAQDLVVTDTWLKAHPAEAAKLQRAVVKALEMIKADKAVLRAAVVSMFPKITDPVLIDSITNDVAAGYLSGTGVMTPESFKTLMEMMAAADPKLKPVGYADIMIGAAK